MVHEANYNEKSDMSRSVMRGFTNVHSRNLTEFANRFDQNVFFSGSLLNLVCYVGEMLNIEIVYFCVDKFTGLHIYAVYAKMYLRNRTQ